MKQFRKAVLFDYNGTLFFDSDINEIAWRQTINELSDNTIDFDNVYRKYKSVRNHIFIQKVFEMMGKDADEEQIEYWVKRKETNYYQPYCRKHQRNRLSPGCEELLNYLLEKGNPINLCTASIIENVDFYFEYLKLDKWFDKNVIAYDDGTFFDKTEMYKAAAERIGTTIDKCIVIEDSAKSIKEAIKAGCRCVVAIKKEDTPDLPEIKQTIKDLSEIDYSIFD